MLWIAPNVKPVLLQGNYVLEHIDVVINGCGENRRQNVTDICAVLGFVNIAMVRSMTCEKNRYI